MGNEAVAQLEGALTSLRALDFDAMPDPEVEEVMLASARGRCELLAVSCRATRAWDARGVWRNDGSKAAWARLARDTNLSPAEAKADVRHARALESMPHAAAALADGRISAAHLDLLAQADRPSRHDEFVRDEAELVGHCTRRRYSLARREILQWCERVDPDGCERLGRHLLDRTSVTAVTTFEDAVYLNGLLDPVGGAMFLEALRRIERDLTLADRAAGVGCTRGRLRARAIVEMAVRASSAPPCSRRPEPLVCILVGARSMSRLCELSSGATITPVLAADYLPAADVQGFTFTDARTISGVSPQRTFTGWLRRAIQVRDRHCQHASGCDEPIARCDIDHIIADSDGGSTSVDNGRLQCTTHNRNHTLHNSGPPPPQPDVER
jgi:hypothetical protein